jgi:hypothetical protein
MAGTTPVFGLPYPHMSDPIDPAAFAALASAIEAVLAGTQQLLDLRLRPPTVALQISSVAVIAPATPTTLSFGSEFYDSHGMWSSGTNVTVQLTGIYHVGFTDAVMAGFATHTSTEFIIRVNGVNTLTERRFASLASSENLSFGGLLILNAGDVITVQCQFSGTGNSNFQVGHFYADFIAPLV